MTTHSQDSPSPAALRSLAPAGRIAAIADPGSVRSVDGSFDAPRPSPHLARWGIAAHDDDGIVVARGAIGGVPLLIAAQDEQFLGGSAGANHSDTLRRFIERGKKERPAAVVVLCASGGVRLHEANAAEWALARALAALLDLRAAGVPVLAVGIADVFGGAAVLACAAERTALLTRGRLGLSGPAVIETACGKKELDARDAAAVAAVFGAEARAAAGQVELIGDDADAVRRWIGQALRESTSLATWVRTTQQKLGARLASATTLAAGNSDVSNRRHAPLPGNLARLYAQSDPVDRTGWLSRLSDRPIWLCRPVGDGTFGPREAHELDAALLAHVGPAAAAGAQTLIVIGDSRGHEVSLRAEALCVAQYLAQHAAVLALLRAQGNRLCGILSGVGHSAEFFANVLQASEVDALTDARVIAMEPAAVARVTRLPRAELLSLIENDPLLGQPVRHFARWAGIAELLPDADPDRIELLATRRSSR